MWLIYVSFHVLPEASAAILSSDEDDDPPPQRRRLHDLIRENYEIYNAFNHDTKVATNSERTWTARIYFELKLMN